jgi:hypothetical protein
MAHVTSGILYYHKWSEGDSTPIADDSGEGHTVASTGAVYNEGSPSVSGPYRTFVVADSDTLNVYDWPNNNAQSLTFEAIICLANLDQRNSLFGQDYGRNCFWVTTDGKLAFNVVDSAAVSRGTFATAAGSIEAGTKYHVVAVLDDTANTVQFYINGQPSGSAGSYGAVDNGYSGGTVFGKVVLNVSGWTSFYLAGDVYLVRAYNRALSAEEVLQNYNDCSWKVAGTGDPLLSRRRLLTLLGGGS